MAYIRQEARLLQYIFSAILNKFLELLLMLFINMSRL